MHGSWQSALPSRFITELPQDHVDTIVDEGFYGGSVGFRDNAGGQEFADVGAIGNPELLAGLCQPACGVQIPTLDVHRDRHRDQQQRDEMRLLYHQQPGVGLAQRRLPATST